MKRYLQDQVISDLKRKMVFLGGPRQVGKTTLAKTVLKSKEGYLNWDISTHRERILENNLPIAPLLCFDEIHKYSRWRDLLKGVYDELHDQTQILVTGSARLDYYRYSGDSLQGRYHYLRLHPFSVAELNIKSEKDFTALLTLGGFPEPFLSSSEKEAKRWSVEYRKRLFEEDVRTLERVRDLGGIELLAIRLPKHVGSPLSVNSLREDLNTSHRTVANWLEILERLYHIFRIYPFGSPLIRAIKKEPKHYHYDWSVIKNASSKFENLVASHLLKWVQLKQDTEGEEIELRYFRDKDQREVDFVVTLENEPIMLVECKGSQSSPSKHLVYLKKKFPKSRAIQLLPKKVDPSTNGGVETLSAWHFLAELA